MLLLLVFYTLKMEAVSSSEMSVNLYETRRHFLQDTRCGYGLGSDVLRLICLMCSRLLHPEDGGNKFI
jgi:hypothetical protein